MNEGYFWAWGFYLAGVLLLLWAWWRMTRALRPRVIQTALRVLVAIFLLFPFTVDEGYREMAPGFLVYLLALMFEGEGAAARSGMPLLLAVLGGSLLLCSLDVLWSRRQIKQQEHKRQQQDYESLLEESQGTQT